MIKSALHDNLIIVENNLGDFFKELSGKDSDLEHPESNDTIL